MKHLSTKKVAGYDDIEIEFTKKQVDSYQTYNHDCKSMYIIAAYIS